MCKFDNTFTFQELLNYCGDQSSPFWQSAWREFIKRYKSYIYNKVHSSCSTWNLPRLQRQISETVNDVVNEVFLQLIKNRCQALQDFRARDNELMFLSWLATICNRISGRYIKNFFSMAIIDGKLENSEININNIEFNKRWELYEHFIEIMRASGIKKKRHLERDINIFQMYIWADFSASMISVHPCFKNVGHRVVDNVVNRMRNYLKDGQKILS